MMRTKQSRLPFAETVARLNAAIAEAGNTLFATIDQSAAARGVGLSLRPTTLIVFGNPRGGTPLMEAFPLVALELPLKILVWEEDDAVNVGYETVAEIAGRYGVSGMDARIAAMDAALDALTRDL
jgi:uncharacterized protein (DUF302 family)